MKAYERKCTRRFAHPEDMQKILNYLNERGKILVKESTIEDLYYDFSHRRYSAGWLIVDDEVLEEFEEWLVDVDI